MLPLNLQFIIAMIAYAINERMAQNVEYLQEEVRIAELLLPRGCMRRGDGFSDTRGHG